MAAHNLPSLKTLLQISKLTPESAKALRQLLTARSGADLEAMGPTFPATDEWIRSCYHQPSFHAIKFAMADELIGGYGVEFIRAGHNAKSPSFEYINLGDTYTTTLLYINGRYRVGCYGDIIERGNYD